jgi:beta-N-acetylhexosaminidase
MMIIAAFAACAVVPTEAPRVAATPSGSAASQAAAHTPSPSDTATPTPTESFTIQHTCAQLVTTMSLSERIGQLLMVGISSSGISASERTIVAGTRAGSVLLLGNSSAGTHAIRRVASRVRDAAHTPEGVQVMLAADQEGGLVQRLKGRGFAAIPSATLQAKQSDAELRRNAYNWGRQLKAAGVSANLAPVADVVPMAMVSVNQPIGRLRRGYGPSVKTVAAKVTAFTDGMDRAGVATAVKHFPGLGRVRGNTDFVRRVVDMTTTRRDAALAGFDASVDAGVDMVMVSSAFYGKIDAERRAAFSTMIIGEMLRKNLGFSGVVISDDLAAVTMRNLTPKERARRFIRAGGDLLIVGNARLAPAMADAIKDEASDDPTFAKRVTESAVRVVAMKERRGLARC